MRRRFAILAFAFLVLVGSLAGSVPGEALPATQPSQFVRFVEDGQGGGTLQVALNSYVDPAGHRVDLISAIHVAEPQFYEALNEKFSAYDRVLYEMITDGEPHAHLAAGGVPATHERLMRELGLQSQLRGIDYDRHNFVHADLTWREMAMLEHQEDADRSAVGGVITGLARGLTKTSEQRQMELAVTGDLLASLKVAPAERSRLWRRAIARGMVVDTQARFGSGHISADDSVLIGARNQKALSVLDSELAARSKTVAMLYGAGHMPDMEHQLVARRGFRRTAVEWITVWAVAPDPPDSSPACNSSGTSDSSSR
jgi:hypothetical protein